MSPKASDELSRPMPKNESVRAKKTNRLFIRAKERTGHLYYGPKNEPAGTQGTGDNKGQSFRDPPHGHDPSLRI